MKSITDIDSNAGFNLPLDIDGVHSLVTLALDLHWSWNHATDRIWRQLDPTLWHWTHNPWVVLHTVSRDHLQNTLADPDYRRQVEDLVREQRLENGQITWFEERCSQKDLSLIAYFSMEFMLSEALPIYAGGLGNVAGDQMKAASDLGVPVVGIGLLYQQGYFRQEIDQHGGQQEFYPYNDPGQLPITPVRKSDGEWLRIEITLPGYSVWIRTWQVKVGRNKLYLLDSNDPANLATHRGITSELYGGGLEIRLKQELILGIGGWRLLQALDLNPEVCHLNEGHAAFAVLERARLFMAKTGQPFDVALTVTRAGNLFTTHTPVPAGFDRFPAALIKQYLRRYAEQRLGITMAEFLALGQYSPNDCSEFNMALLAVRGSGAINGVSRLHGEVSRELFSPLFPRWPWHEVPITHVTNGVHVPSWDSAAADQLWTSHCGKERWRGRSDIDRDAIAQVTDAQLWQMRTREQQYLIDYVRAQVSRQVAAQGRAEQDIEAAKSVLDPHTLTLVFARRFAPYKRPNLLLRDPDRLVRLITHPEHPIQLIIAGKAHPGDQHGQAILREWTAFAKRPEIRDRVVFLSDYNMRMAEHLVAGADVWLNTPRRPWEASGTSGMKVLVNGGINVSELDGWWAEAYSPEVGWALGDGQQHHDEQDWDARESEQLYRLLESEIVPEFYQRDQSGVPSRWVHRMRRSMAQLTYAFSATRSVKDYTTQHYLSAAVSYHKRLTNDCALGQQLVDWRRLLDTQWLGLSFIHGDVTTHDGAHHFQLGVHLNGIPSSAISVELYSEAVPEHDRVQQRMQLGEQISGEHHVYCASVPASRPPSDFTARIIPLHPDANIPLEATHILWQK